jgi:hypothetical protein
MWQLRGMDCACEANGRKFKSTERIYSHLEKIFCKAIFRVKNPVVLLLLTK